MTTTTTQDRPMSAASDAYLAAVGEALAGISDSDRQELLDDLAEHLGEMAPEHDTELVERLGTPQQYAAELLASAGIEPAATKGRARSKLAERVRAVASTFDAPAARTVRDFAVELRPGWWVARAWILLAALALLAESRLREALPFPNLTHNDILNFGLLVGAIVVSVWVGRWSSAGVGRERNWATWIATALGILATFSLLTADRSSYTQVDFQQYNANSGSLVDPSGNYISNIFAYDASGKPLAGVYLFSQDGVPLDVGNGASLQENGVPFISGLFPQPDLITDNNGLIRGVQPTPPQVSVPRLPEPTPPTQPRKTAQSAKPPTTSPNTSPTTEAGGGTGLPSP